MKKVPAPCSTCVRETTHDVLFETPALHTDYDTIDTYALLSCCGCSTISLGHQRLWQSDGSVEHKYYPSPVSRKRPEWVLLNLPVELGALLREIYQAIDGSQYRLAAMGIRALLEQVMISKVGDLKTFDAKLDEFQKQGYVSLVQRDAMRPTLDVGDAAMHRAFKPMEQDLKLALDVVEGVLAPIFAHKEAAEGRHRPQGHRAQDRGAGPAFDHGRHSAGHHVRAAEPRRRRGSGDHEAGRRGNRATAAYLPGSLRSNERRERLELPWREIFIAAAARMCRVIESFTPLESFDVYRDREVV
jgi:hypothetical protein